MTFLHRVVTPLLLAVFLTPPLGAQAPQELTPGQDIQGALRHGDRQTVNGGYQDQYTFAAEAGQSLEIDLSSDVFDTLLRLRAPSGAEQVNDDRAPGDTDSALALTVEETGVHTLTVTSLAPGGAGVYALRVDLTDPNAPMPAAAPTGPASLVFGQPIVGTLESGDATSATGRFEDEYHLRGVTGQRVAVRLSSGDFDAYLRMIAPSGQSIFDDDGGGGNDALLEVTLGSDDVYTIIATSFEADESGTYTLTAEQIQTPVGNAPIPIAMGQRIQGDLRGTDSQRATGQRQDIYTFNGSAGQGVMIRMEAGSLDPYLILRAPSGMEISDDDSGGMLNAAITMTLAESGRHEIAATSFAPNQTGSYTLTLTSGPTSTASSAAPGASGAAPSIRGTPIAMGQTVMGRLDPTDEIMPDGSHLDRYTFDAVAGQVLDIRMRSDEIDSYLIHVTPSGIQTDDDDGDGMPNARIQAHINEPGTHMLVATSFLPGAQGNYAIRIAPLDVPPDSTGGRLEVGQTVEGLLGGGDPVTETGEYCDEYEIQVDRGQRIRVSLTSPDFDAYLIVVDPSGFQQEVDDTMGTDAAMEIEMSAAGTARIGATSYFDGESGRYRLAVEDASGLRASQLRHVGNYRGQVDMITAGQSRTGVLGAGDTPLPGGQLADGYHFFGQPGQHVTVEMTSDQFDPFLILLGPGELQVDDDNSGGGTTARIALDLPQVGRYTLLCTSAEVDERGNYSFSIR